MQEAIQYIKKLFFDIDSVEDIDTSKIPLYLKDKFELKNINLFGNNFIFAKYKEKQSLFIEIINKDFAQIKKYTNRYPIIILDNLRLNQRENLIKNKIPFIIPGTQVFIPYPPISLTEIEKREKVITEKFKKSTQVVFAYLLLNQLENINAHRIADKLGYSATTANRALNELVDKGLIIQSDNATRKKYIIADKKEYWEKGRQFLFNPVTDTILVMKDRIDVLDERLYKSNDTALYEYSDYFDEYVNREKHFACNSNSFNELYKHRYPNVIDYSMSNFVAIEMLSYDPGLLSKDDKVDPVTLYAQYIGKQDERIEIALDEIMGKIING